MSSTADNNLQKIVSQNPSKLGRGKRLGKYRLVKRLGMGGYCEVWKARDGVEGIWVALKIPLIHNGQRDNESLLREVKLVSRLRHEHILPVKNADIIDGHAVLATELSVGTLEECSRPMGVRRIVSIISQVLDGLAYAHRNRLVHCDVTPGNIFLFPNGRAALGDFGIGQQIKGRMVTIDEYGTPGYVAPEQAYGRPTYRSDCFAVSLILYEYLTGVLPRWPFRWPFKGVQRLRERTTSAMVQFLRKGLAVEPARRYANAEQMLTTLQQVLPRPLRNDLKVAESRSRKKDWRQIRREAYDSKYRNVFPSNFRCIECGEPVAETMSYCPWCGSDRNRYDACSQFNHICTRCHKGVLPEWHYCGWCFGAGFQSPSEVKSPGIRYHAHCKYCKGGLMRFMRYCPWCRRKVRKAWQVRPFPERCGRCGWSVDSSFWNYCPWCRYNLLPY